jgi:hypothetical protein
MCLKLIDVSENISGQSSGCRWIVQGNVVGDRVQISQGWLGSD